MSSKQVLGMACNIAENLHALQLRVGEKGLKGDSLLLFQREDN